MAKSIVFIDSEVGEEDKKIHDLGAVRYDSTTFHSASISDFCSFISNSEFLCGHNIIHHDMAFIIPHVIGNITDFSKSFLEKLAKLKKKGYKPVYASVGFIVAWQGEDDIEESAVILPDLYLTK